MYRTAIPIAFIATLFTTTGAEAAQRVIATWYGDELRGRRTANGEVFNPDG